VSRTLAAVVTAKGPLTPRDHLRAAVVFAMRHLAHPYSDGRRCVEEILDAVDEYDARKAGEES
jgi:hypothetical protein